MVLGISVSGREAVARFLDATPDFVLQSGDVLCEAVAVSTEVHAKRLVPVRSGKLQRSIRAERVREGEWRVGSDVSYSGFVEFGTSSMAAQPFLRPAAEIAKTEAAMAASAAFFENLGRFK